MDFTPGYSGGYVRSCSSTGQPVLAPRPPVLKYTPTPYREMGYGAFRPANEPVVVENGLFQAKMLSPQVNACLIPTPELGKRVPFQTMLRPGALVSNNTARLGAPIPSKENLSVSKQTENPFLMSRNQSPRTATDSQQTTSPLVGCNVNFNSQELEDDDDSMCGNNHVGIFTPVNNNNNSNLTPTLSCSNNNFSSSLFEQQPQPQPMSISPAISSSSSNFFQRYKTVQNMEQMSKNINNDHPINNVNKNNGRVISPVNCVFTPVNRSNASSRMMSSKAGAATTVARLSPVKEIPVSEMDNEKSNCCDSSKKSSPEGNNNSFLSKLTPVMEATSSMEQDDNYTHDNHFFVEEQRAKTWPAQANQEQELLPPDALMKMLSDDEEDDLSKLGRTRSASNADLPSTASTRASAAFSAGGSYFSRKQKLLARASSSGSSSTTGFGITATRTTKASSSNRRTSLKGNTTSIISKKTSSTSRSSLTKRVSQPEMSRRASMTEKENKPRVSIGGKRSVKKAPEKAEDNKKRRNKRELRAHSSMAY